MRRQWAAFRRVCRALTRIRALEARAAKDPGADWPVDRDYVPVTDDKRDAPIGAVIDGWERRGFGWYRLHGKRARGAAVDRFCERIAPGLSSDEAQALLEERVMDRLRGAEARLAAADEGDPDGR